MSCVHLATDFRERLLSFHFGSVFVIFFCRLSGWVSRGRAGQRNGERRLELWPWTELDAAVPQLLLFGQYHSYNNNINNNIVGHE